MTQPAGPQRPIGYWLKQVDALLTEEIDRAQAQHGVTRLEWQTLNLIAAQGSTSRTSLHTTLAPFADDQRLDEIAGQLVTRGFVAASASETGEATYALTSTGQQQHAAILSTQQRVRQRATEGISADEYAAAVDVLQRMAHNLSRGAEG
jgi:DNA-binding MarR family transcriptional regulator